MDDRNPYPELEHEANLATELLAAATARAHGNEKATIAIGQMLEQLNTTNILGFMAGWVAGAAVLVPLPAGVIARADYEPRLEGGWDLDSSKEGAAIGSRIFAAFANDDADTAAALWETALTRNGPGQKVSDLALLTVLHRSALIIARNSPRTT